jgi:formate/nitrite transporter FocA (FNT family)
MASTTEDLDSNAAGHPSPHLDDRERDQAKTHSTPRALFVQEVIRQEGETALERSALALMWSALAAGIVHGILVSHAGGAANKAVPSSAGGIMLIGAAGYCVGFIIVVPGRQQLFTEPSSCRC